MFEGIKLKTLLSTPQEWHALVIGFFEVLCPWKPRYTSSSDALTTVLQEYHYYMAGRGLGLVALVFLALTIAKFILEVLL